MALQLYSVVFMVLYLVCVTVEDGCPDDFKPVCSANDTMLTDSTSIYINNCTLTGVTANFSGHDGISLLSFSWICESDNTRKVYGCSGNTASYVHLLPIKEEHGSSCYIEGCVYSDKTTRFHRILSNVCIITKSTENITTTFAHLTTDIVSLTHMLNTTVVSSLPGNKNNYLGVLAPVLGVLTLLLLILLAIVVVLYSVLQFRMRMYRRNWQVYNNSELPFDPHYSPVDIEKPTFKTSKRMSLLSMDNIFQSLYLDQAKGSLRYKTEQIATSKNFPSVVCDDEYDNQNSYVTSTLFKGELSDCLWKPSVRDEKKMFNFTSSGDSCESYLQNYPPQILLALTPSSEGCDSACKDDSHRSKIDERVYGWGNSSCSEVNSFSLVPFPPTSFSSLLVDQRQSETKSQKIHLDGEYVYSENGYIQSHVAQIEANGYIQSHVAQIKANETNESIRSIDIDLSVSPAMIKEYDEQSTDVSIVDQSHRFPTCLSDIEVTETNSVLNYYYTPSSDTDEEIGIVVWDEPSTSCSEKHWNGYTATIAQAIVPELDPSLSEYVQSPCNINDYGTSDNTVDFGQHSV